jgi:iron-sulfur cluster assembly protein
MLTLTPAAIQQFKTAIDSSEMVRIGVRGGGCAGMSYSIEIETDFDEEDLIIEFDHVKIYIDPHSAGILDKTTIDYTETLYQKGFQFLNPEANTTCGCGMSFS